MWWEKKSKEIKHQQMLKCIWGDIYDSGDTQLCGFLNEGCNEEEKKRINNIVKVLLSKGCIYIPLHVDSLLFIFSEGERII